MITKAKASPEKSSSPAKVTLAGPWLTPAWTLEERLRRIELIGQKIDEYIRFMCQADQLNGASLEAKEHSVTAFYEKMVAVEKQLARIHDELRLS